ncbi:MAG: [FeFe] hydrogenase H-cluster radical SAM maturase HydE, partial [Clostridiales bacterium]
MTKNQELIDQLIRDRILPQEQLIALLDTFTPVDREYAAVAARKIAQANFGLRIYTRGLIEFSNYCKNDCYYCGIRRSNLRAERFRL